MKKAQPLLARLSRATGRLVNHDAQAVFAQRLPLIRHIALKDVQFEVQDARAAGCVGPNECPDLGVIFIAAQTRPQKVTPSRLYPDGGCVVIELIQRDDFASCIQQVESRLVAIVRCISIQEIFLLSTYCHVVILAWSEYIEGVIVVETPEVKFQCVAGDVRLQEEVVGNIDIMRERKRFVVRAWSCDFFAVRQLWKMRVAIASAESCNE